MTDNVAATSSKPRARWMSVFEAAVPVPLNSAGVLMLAFRWLVVGCQAATILITWPLWQVHAAPPMVPLLTLPQLSLGVALLVSLALVLVAPMPGITLHTVLLVYAIAIDQTRLQPEIVSLVFLMWGSLASPTAKAFARAHLVSMWLFAGFNKLLSPGFMNDTAQWMLSGLVSNPPRWLYDNFGYVVACTELGVGVLALMPRTRKLAAVGALGLHFGILMDLGPFGHDTNQAVWPWNVALAVAGFALIATWKESPLAWIRALRPVVRPFIVLMFIAPFGFYVGVTDAYLAHNLYASNTPRAAVWCARECLPYQSPSATWDAFNVPLPPERRILKKFFAESCRSGDVMVIGDKRWWFRHRGEEIVYVSCPVESASR